MLRISGRRPVNWACFARKAVKFFVVFALLCLILSFFPCFWAFFRVFLPICEGTYGRSFWFCGHDHLPLILRFPLHSAWRRRIFDIRDTLHASRATPPDVGGSTRFALCDEQRTMNYWLSTYKRLAYLLPIYYIVPDIGRQVKFRKNIGIYHQDNKTRRNAGFLIPDASCHLARRTTNGSGSSASSEPSLAGPQLRAFEREGFGVVWPEESFGHGLKFGARGRFLPLGPRTNTLGFGNPECTYPLFARAKNLTFSGKKILLSALKTGILQENWQDSEKIAWRILLCVIEYSVIQI